MKRWRYPDGELWQGDCLEVLRRMPDDAIDLVFTSPPYTAARTYEEDGVQYDIDRDTDEWVAWMLEVVGECCRVCRGLCAFVVDDSTEDYRYNCGPFLLMADLHRAGYNLRKPGCYHRVGIPGSGGPDWLRSDWEPIICVTPPGKLPWSDNKADGAPPKFFAGGAATHRRKDGRRANRRSHATSGYRGGDASTETCYAHPDVANPGNVVQETYTAAEVAKMLGGGSDVVSCAVGGGKMGSNIAHENEAPFPTELPRRYVRSFCPPGGTVFDPFSGSGTTLAEAVRWGRKFVGVDLRLSQVGLCQRRVKQARSKRGFGL